MIDLTDAADSGPLSISADSIEGLFDGLPPCSVEMLRGCWRGQETLTGHPLDGALAKVSWYGKRFDRPDAVHPLMVSDASGRPFPLNPALVPMAAISSPLWTPSVTPAIAPHLMSMLRGVVRARTYGAEVSMTTHRGVSTAAVTYRDKPIVDVFRRVDTATVLGLMEYPGMPRPYFFVLRRDEPS